MADLMDRQPLVLGAMPSVGAAMAAALPSTAVEMHLLSEASVDLQARTRESVPPRETRVGSPLVLTSAMGRAEAGLRDNFLTWTAGNLLRHTVCVRLREDKPTSHPHSAVCVSL